MKSEPIVSARTYIVVWVSLLILTLTTTGVAFIDLGGQWNTLTAVLFWGGEKSFVVGEFLAFRF